MMTAVTGSSRLGSVAALRRRPVAVSVDELLDGAVRSGRYLPDDSRSSALFERVEVDGQRCVVKYVHPDHDFTMRVSGDIGCRPRKVWAAGLMDLVPEHVDHGQLGAAPWGRNGWGVALLMRDLSDELIPVGDQPVSAAEHLRFLDSCAAMAAASWRWRDAAKVFLPHHLRWAWFGTHQLAGEERLEFPELVPKLAVAGWQRFAAKVADLEVRDAVDALRLDTRPLSQALLATPQCFLHGDWKFGNLGTARDGRTVLIDWAYPGEGPIAHELGWYLALNRARLPVGHDKQSTIDDFRAALERHGVDTEPWWQLQLDLCLLGALVQFGWEKALGDGEDADAELAWWVDAARRGLRLL
jgi:hypothetical protein